MERRAEYFWNKPFGNPRFFKGLALAGIIGILYFPAPFSNPKYNPPAKGTQYSSTRDLETKASPSDEEHKEIIRELSEEGVR